MQQDKTAQCMACGETKTVNPHNFQFQKGRPWSLKKCKECLRKKKADQRIGVAEECDWVQVYMRDVLQPRMRACGERVALITAYDIRALLMMQDSMCAVFPTIRLECPVPASMHRSWSTLITYPVRMDCAPEVARVYRDRPWEPGNVSIVCWAAYRVCSVAGDISSAIRLMRGVNTPAVCSRDSVRRTATLLENDVRAKAAEKLAAANKLEKDKQ